MAAILVDAGPLYAYVDADDAQHGACVELVWTYRDLPLGTVDASLVAAGERLGIKQVATTDGRHFLVMRRAHAAAFTLLP